MDYSNRQAKGCSRTKNSLGRKGKFKIDKKSDTLKYIPSGEEPRIVAYSRSGIPLSARAKNQRSANEQYKAKFLTLKLVKQMREKGQIDFEKQILPLLILDMEFAYYQSYFKDKKNLTDLMIFNNLFKSLSEKERKKLIDKEVPNNLQFSWEKMSNPYLGVDFSTYKKFENWLLDYLKSDLKEAKKGNVDSPVKAACDVLRDLRDNLRAAIDFGGLLECSHIWLYKNFLPIMNRLSVGPPKERIAEVLALIESNILDISWGKDAYLDEQDMNSPKKLASKIPGNRKIDVHYIINARVPMPDLKNSPPTLIDKLLKNGIAKLYYNGSFHPGGIEVDKNFNLINEKNEVIPNIWALGLPTEGIKFYTFIVPRPSVCSTAIVDAGVAVKKMLNLICERNN